MKLTGWHGSTSHAWFNSIWSRLIRGYGNSIFNYYAYREGTYSSTNPDKTGFTRAVIVVGTGF